MSDTQLMNPRTDELNNTTTASSPEPERAWAAPKD